MDRNLYGKIKKRDSRCVLVLGYIIIEEYRVSENPLAFVQQHLLKPADLSVPQLETIMGQLMVKHIDMADLYFQYAYGILGIGRRHFKRRQFFS